MIVINSLTIGFIIVYCLCLISYMIIEVKDNFKKRAINKIILAALFMSFASIIYFCNYQFSNIQGLLLISMFFAFLGDIILLFKFKIGASSFLICNIFLMIYQILILSNVQINITSLIWTIPIYLILYFTFLIVSHKYSFNFNKKQIPIYMYLSCMTTNGLLATITLFTKQNNILFSLGVILFMISDYLLITYKFKFKKNLLLQLNSCFYFTGMLLIALSLL